MKIAILSDIHANQLALDAVLQSMDKQHIKRYWFLGDVVGYGPQPAEPLRWLKEHVASRDWVLGNHDAIFADLLTPVELANINRVPLVAAEGNHKALEDQVELNAFWQQAFIREKALPVVHKIDDRIHLLVHGGQGLVDKESEGMPTVRGMTRPNLFLYVYAWNMEEYLKKSAKLRIEFTRLRALQKQFKGLPCIQWFGHTHVPTLVRGWNRDDDIELHAERVFPGKVYTIDSDLALINPGSVGQPRDMDQRAAYAVFDTEKNQVQFFRVSYDWRKMIRILATDKYPAGLVRRLRTANPINETPAIWIAHYQEARKVACL